LQNGKGYDNIKNSISIRKSGGTRMEKPTKKIQVIREIEDDDKVVKEALEIAKRFKVLTYSEAYEILLPKLGIGDSAKP